MSEAPFQLIVAMGFAGAWAAALERYPVADGFHITLQSPGFFSTGQTWSELDRWYCCIQRGATPTAACFTEFGDGWGDTPEEAIANAMGGVLLGEVSR